MKHTLFVTLSTLLALAAGPVLAQTQPPFPLVQTVGSGSDESFFVLDFEDGTANQSYAFGYLYNEPAAGPQITGYDMAQALVNANIGLTDQVTFYSFSPGTLTPFIDSVSYSGHSQDDKKTSGYWSYWTSTDGLNWMSSPVGAADRILTNGSYDAWAWDANYAVISGPVTPHATSAVPEPGAGWLLLAGLPLTLIARRRARE